MFTLCHGVRKEIVFKANYCYELWYAGQLWILIQISRLSEGIRTLKQSITPVVRFLLVTFHATFDPCFQAGDHAVTNKKKNVHEGH